MPSCRLRHEADVGGAEVLVHLGRLVVLDAQHDRRPAAAREALVDPVGERAHLRLELLVLLDAGARRRADLHEREAADPLRLELEQALDRAEALEDALGVVDPVDADADRDVVGDRVARADGGAALGDRPPVRRLGGRPFDRDRVALHRRGPAAVGHA